MLTRFTPPRSPKLLRRASRRVSRSSVLLSACLVLAVVYLFHSAISTSDLVTWNDSGSNDFSKFFLADPLEPLQAPLKAPGPPRKPPVPRYPIRRQAAANLAPSRTAATGYTGDELTYDADGLVRWNGTSPHPIDVLIARGQSRWDKLLARQSVTLAQAVKEYRRRYARDPPEGFDTWFRFAKKRRVKIIDDYDQIDRDIRHWLAIPPAEFRRRVELLDELQHSYKITLGPSPTLTGDQADNPRAGEHFDLLRPLIPYLPAQVSLVISNHDMGNTMPSAELRSSLLDHVARGKYIDLEELARLENPKHVGTGILLACAPDSPARKIWDDQRAAGVSKLHDASFSGGGEPKSQVSFIHDPWPMADFCTDPSLLDLHGAFSWRHRRGTNLRPVFQQSKLVQNGDLMLTPLEAYKNASSAEGIKSRSAWDEKTKARVFWRGSVTGDSYSSRTALHWRKSHRPRWHLFANADEGESDVWVQTRRGWTRDSFLNYELNEHFFDAGIIGSPNQCDEKDGTCAEMEAAMVAKEWVRPEAARAYKYAFDIDGNGWSSRFHRLLGSGSVVLKTTIYPEWMSDWLTPWVHYVPVQTDLSDMYDILSYFIGMPGGAGNDDAARRIAEAGGQFTREHWRWEDMQAYMLRLLLEYARLNADDRETASYHR